MSEPNFADGTWEFCGFTDLSDTEIHYEVYENSEGQFWLSSLGKMQPGEPSLVKMSEIEKRGPFTARELLYKIIGYENE